MRLLNDDCFREDDSINSAGPEREKQRFPNLMFERGPEREISLLRFPNLMFERGRPSTKSPLAAERKLRLECD